jgi:hypothetical protein
MKGLRRRFVTLLTALTFTVVAISGILTFVREFSFPLVGLHALMGFVFIGVVSLHIENNIRPLIKFGKSRVLWICLVLVAGLSVLFWIQPTPVQRILSWSGNLGPAMERFDLHDDGLNFSYSPAHHYRMALTVQAGAAYYPNQPPAMAIWLENQGGYHIKTLHGPEQEAAKAALPYWHFKVRGWAQAKADAESNAANAETEEVDGLSGATPNGSFDPADYILPATTETVTPYKLLIEINQPGDASGMLEDQPPLVYAVEIDNARPVTFQVLDLVGYPRRESTDGKEEWALYYIDETIDSALTLVDSALLRINRGD